MCMIVEGGTGNWLILLILFKDMLQNTPSVCANITSHVVTQKKKQRM